MSRAEGHRPAVESRILEEHRPAANYCLPSLICLLGAVALTRSNSPGKRHLSYAEFCDPADADAETEDGV